jgi:hypothetical protein
VGNINPPDLPPELWQMITTRLDGQSASLGNFTPLINCVERWHIEETDVQKISKILSAAGHQFNDVGSPETYLIYCMG